MRISARKRSPSTALPLLVHMCTYICMYVRMYVCVHLCISIYIYVRANKPLRIWISVRKTSCSTPRPCYHWHMCSYYWHICILYVLVTHAISDASWDLKQCVSGRMYILYMYEHIYVYTIHVWTYMCTSHVLWILNHKMCLYIYSIQMDTYRPTLPPIFREFHPEEKFELHFFLLRKH